jgi:putative aldouronate transport system permease protein
MITLLTIFPFWLLISASLTDETTAVNQGFNLIPKLFSTEAYRFLFDSWMLFGRAYLVSIIVTVCGVFMCVVVTLTFGYAISREGLPGRRVLSFLVIFTMLFNGGLVSTYLMYTSTFHIKDTLWALIIPSLVTNAFFIILVKNYFLNSIPIDLFEAAKIDGTSEFGTFIKIAVPLAKPIIATLILMSGVTYWNDWQNGLYYLDDQKVFGIQNLLQAITSSTRILASGAGAGIRLPTETVRMAAAAIAILPILIAYPFFQEYFVRGITMGGVKE